MPALIRKIASLLALLVIPSGAWQSAALGQGNLTGVWSSDAGACPVAMFEIESNGNVEAWASDGELDPVFPDVQGKVKISGNKIESNMKEGGAGIMRVALQGTISGNQITAQVTLTEGKKKLAGSCVFRRR